MLQLVKKRLLPVLCIGLVVGATACNKKAAEPPPEPTPTGVNVTGLELGREIGDDKRVKEQVSQFAPKDVIYASVLTSGSSPTVILKARWTYQDGQLIEETDQTIAPTGNAATEFHVSRPDGWPVGRYKVEISLNGNPVKASDFEVR